MKLLLQITLMVLFFSGCAAKPKLTEGNLVHHVVLVKFQSELTEKERRQIYDASKKLARIPYVRQMHIGWAIKSERKIVDRNFDMGITFVFKDKKAMNDYLVWPEHTAFVKKFLAGKIESVKVYDY